MSSVTDNTSLHNATYAQINDVINYIIQADASGVLYADAAGTISAPLSTTNGNINVWIGKNLNFHPFANSTYAGKYIRTSALSLISGLTPAPAPAAEAGTVGTPDIAYILISGVLNHPETTDGNFTQISSAIAIVQNITTVASPTPSFLALPESSALNDMILRTHNIPPANAIIGAIPPGKPSILSIDNVIIPGDTATHVKVIFNDQISGDKAIKSYTIMAVSNDSGTANNATMIVLPPPANDLTKNYYSIDASNNYYSIMNGLIAGRTYNITIYATSDIGNSPTSDSIPINVISAPTTPISPVVSSTSDGGKITITFSTISNNVSISNGGTNMTFPIKTYYNDILVTNTTTTLSTTSSASSTSVTISGLTNGKSYKFVLSAKTTEGGESLPCNDIISMPIYKPDPIIGNISYVRTSVGNILLTFATPKSNGADINYTTEYTSDHADTDIIFSTPVVNGLNTNITVSGLSLGNIYSFTITPKNSVGSTTSKTISNIIAKTNPGKVTVTSNTHSDTTVSLTFVTPDSGGSQLSYIVKVTPVLSPLVTFNGIFTSSVNDEGTITTLLITSLEPFVPSPSASPSAQPPSPYIGPLITGTAYNFVVISKNADGSFGQPSTAVSLTPAKGPPNISNVFVTNLQKVGGGVTGLDGPTFNARVSFTAPIILGDLTTYTVTPEPYVTDSTAADKIKRFSANSDASGNPPAYIAVSGLKVATSYTMHVQAKNSLGSGNTVNPPTSVTPGSPGLPYFSVIQNGPNIVVTIGGSQDASDVILGAVPFASTFTIIYTLATTTYTLDTIAANTTGVTTKTYPAPAIGNYIYSVSASSANYIIHNYDNEGGSLPDTNQSVTTSYNTNPMQTILGTPTIVNVTATYIAGTANATISWVNVTNNSAITSDGSGGAVYIITPYTTAAGTPQNVYTTTPSYTFTDLLANTSYTFKVKAHNPQGWGTESVSPTMTTPVAPTIVVTGTTVPLYDTTKAQITFSVNYSGASKPTAYTATLLDATGNSIPSPAPSVSGGSVAATIATVAPYLCSAIIVGGTTALIGGKTYKLKVTATTTVVSFPVFYTFTTPTTPIPTLGAYTPSTTQNTTAIGGTILATKTDPLTSYPTNVITAMSASKQTLAYKIVRTDGTTASAIERGAISNSGSVTLLTPCKDYTITATATTVWGTSTSLPKSISGCGPIIGTVTVSNVTASVTYTGVTDNAGTALTGITYTLTAKIGATIKTATGVSPIIVKGLTANTTYTFTVTAAKTGSTFIPSASPSFKTLTNPGPVIGTVTTTGLTATVPFIPALDSNGVPMTGVSYTANAKISATLKSSASSPTSPINLTTGLLKNTAYTFSVKAVKTGTTFVDSANVTASTTNAAAGGGLSLEHKTRSIRIKQKKTKKNKHSI